MKDEHERYRPDASGWRRHQQRNAPSCGVIGGARGANEAARRILKGLPSSLPAAVIVVVHSVPGGDAGESAPLVDESFALPIRVAKAGQRIRAGEVLLAPPGCHLRVVEGETIEIDGPKLMRTSRPAIDMLFESAAAVFRRRVVAVVLSGSGDDGTDGLRSVKAAGGITVVQSPSDAKAISMPIAAILGDHPDHCLLVHQIAPLLIKLVGASR